ncbi:energy transducer TonB [Mucilaginibacter pedocola]|uniref:TonB C-terminal domain-containing protein n=1 Tax=Mucilaginibacter pedocola TaxID=1792845 RepID=A0A1S9PK15_9SPHI|nr:energy transducer TonB [Mucilaginibacter pedocola]OOQ61306.1 hypothetical protein BC343_20190 [Mucilaginibacter pedocola]
MKPNLFILLCLLPFFAAAQTSEHVVEDNARRLKEKYYVLNSNNEIRQGEYKAFGKYSSLLQSDGFYKNNLKDSVWHEYSYAGKVLLEGNYKAGARTGEWCAFDNDGRLLIKYDYDKQELRTLAPLATDSTLLYRVVGKEGTAFSRLDRPPIYLDGEVLFKAITSRTVTYPQQAREAYKTGTVIITFNIGADGSVSKYKVTKGLGFGLDEAAMVAVKAANGQWLPAIAHGKPVAIEYDVPVTFALGGY